MLDARNILTKNALFSNQAYCLRLAYTNKEMFGTCSATLRVDCRDVTECRVLQASKGCKLFRDPCTSRNILRKRKTLLLHDEGGRKDWSGKQYVS